MDGGEAVRVVVQARPLLAGETDSVVNLALPHRVRLTRPPSRGVPAPGGSAALDEFGPYDAVCAPGPGSTNEVYAEHVSGLVQSMFEGINGTVMAYGQTASGKTYTMTGLGGLVADDVFAKAAEKAKEKNVTVRVSFVEVYQESIRDLVDAVPASGNRGRGGSSTGVVNVTVRTRRNGSVFLDGAREVPVRNAPQLLALVEAGARARQTAATGMNATSSRSHSIITITVEQEPFNAAPGASAAAAAGGSSAPGYLTAKLHLVDLAGSERTKRCTSGGGARFAEGVSINSGLLALAKVITALAGSSSHVPYRESKLTRLLQDSLGGNSRSLVFACVSPCAASREETASTLRYAMRIKNIRNKPRVNVDPAAVENSDLRAALSRARAHIAALTAENEKLRKMVPYHVARSLPTPIKPPRPDSPDEDAGPGPAPLISHANVQDTPPALQMRAGGVAATQDGPLSSSFTDTRSAATPSQPIVVADAHTSLSSAGTEQSHPLPRRRPSPRVRRTASESSMPSPAKPPLAGVEVSTHRTPTKAAATGRGGSSQGKKDTEDPDKTSPARTPARSVVNTPKLTPDKRRHPGDGSLGGSIPASPEIEPGSLMVRLAELESLLHDTTPLRAHSDRLSSRAVPLEKSASLDDASTGSSAPIEVGTVARESSISRRGLPSLIEPKVANVDDPQTNSKRLERSSGDIEAQIRVRYLHQLASVEKEKNNIKLETEALRSRLASIDRTHAAELQTRDAEHQACIAELRSTLADLQKRDSERKTRRLGDASEQDRQRMLRRLAALKASNGELQTKLSEALGKSGESKSTTSNLLRENRNLSKSEKSLRVRVHRLEAIRAKQQETISDLTARERVASIERHRNRHNTKDRDAVKTDTSAPSSSSGSSTLTPRQRQQFLERELLAMIQRRDGGESSKDESHTQARHWAWIRSMDDAKAVLRMCVMQLVEAREERSAGLGCATDKRGPGSPETEHAPLSGNELRPSLETRAKRRSSIGCGTARLTGGSRSLPLSPSITLRCSSSGVSQTGGT